MNLRIAARITAAMVFSLAASASNPAAAATTEGMGNFVTLQLPTGQSTAFGLQDCRSALQIPVTCTLTTIGMGLEVFVTKTTGACPDSADAAQNTTIPLLERSTPLTTTVALNAIDVRSLSPDCAEDVEETWRICAVVWQSATTIGGSESIAEKVPLTITYDTKPPGAPELNPAESGDGTIYLRWTPGNNSSDVSEWRIYYRPTGAISTTLDDPCAPPPDAGPDTGGDATADAGVVDVAASPVEDPTEDPTADPEPEPEQIDLTGWRAESVTLGTAARATLSSGLSNGQTYELLLVAIDGSGNRSLQSNVIEATPRLVQDFYRAYRCAGGQEEGGFALLGCSAVSAPPLVFATALAAVGLAALRARRKGNRR